MDGQHRFAGLCLIPLRFENGHKERHGSLQRPSRWPALSVYSFGVSVEFYEGTCSRCGTKAFRLRVAGPSWSRRRWTASR
jgi:hypothetical protein